jgi:hypothetical protein
MEDAANCLRARSAFDVLAVVGSYGSGRFFRPSIGPHSLDLYKMKVQSTQRLIQDEFISYSSVSHINVKADQRLRRVALGLVHAIREEATPPSAPFSGNPDGHGPMFGVPERQLD